MWAHSLQGAQLSGLDRAEVAPLRKRHVVLSLVKDNRKVGESGSEGAQGSWKERGWSAEAQPSRAWPQTIKEKLVFPRQGLGGGTGLSIYAPLGQAFSYLQSPTNGERTRLLAPPPRTTPLGGGMGRAR